MTGIFSDAAVDGFMSCSGEGLGLMCAVWSVSAIWRGIEEDILEKWSGVQHQFVLYLRVDLDLLSRVTGV